MKGLEFCEAFQSFWRVTHSADFDAVNKEKLQYQGLMVKLMKFMQDSEKEVRGSMIDSTLQRLGLSRSREELPDLPKSTIKQDVSSDVSLSKGFKVFRSDSMIMNRSLSPGKKLTVIRDKRLRKLIEEKTVSVEEMRNEHMPEDGYHLINFKDDKKNKRSTRPPEFVTLNKYE